mgnify:CR=1 FL=1
MSGSTAWQLNDPKNAVVEMKDVQLMSGSGGSDENRATELGEISRGLKMLAKELLMVAAFMNKLSLWLCVNKKHQPAMSKDI